ncbi:hypothetical protein FB451DRAFT_552869 [Mycena latifolia]|nr:hypothetical protein FB451DRAFT_552869 [Mycena latifolia]
MLKRLRPASPPPGSSIPLVSDPPDSLRRDPKRRRILPPSLDGQSRHSMFRTDEDDGEEDHDELNLSDGHNPSGLGPSGSTVYNTEYESANTVLHDLHALHRHRLIFSSPPSYPEHLHPPCFPDKSYAPPIPNYPRAPDIKDTSGRQDFGCQLPYKEVQSVKERYEDTNRCVGSFFADTVDFTPRRLLGSLFLTRRKQLDRYNT